MRRGNDETSKTLTFLNESHRVCLLVLCASMCVCRAPIVSHSYYQWINLDFFLFFSSPGVPPDGASRPLWPILTRCLVRAPLEIPRCSAHRRPMHGSLTGDGGEPRCSVGASDLSRLDCRTAAVPNMDPRQLWLDCHFPRLLVLLLTRALKCYEVGERDTRKRKVLRYFYAQKSRFLQERSDSPPLSFRRATPRFWS